MKKTKFRILRWCLMGIVILTLAGCGSSGAKTGAAGKTPAQSTTTKPTQAPGATLFAEANANALTAGWAHVHNVATQGTVTSTYEGDAGLQQGRQTVIVGASQAQTVLLNSVAYVQGDVSATTQILGFSQAEVGSLANRWIAVAPTDSKYATFSQGVSLQSVLDEVKLTEPFTTSLPTTIDGVTAIGVTGTVPGSDADGGQTGTLYVTDNSNPVPVQFSTINSTASETIDFTGWGGPVSLAVPPDAIAYSSIS